MVLMLLNTKKQLKPDEISDRTLQFEVQLFIFRAS
jgi:hypothetical protein